MIEGSEWAYTGGAHGNGGSSCSVYDLYGGNEIHLARFLKPAVAALVRKWALDVIEGADVAHDFALSDGEICPGALRLSSSAP